MRISSFVVAIALTTAVCLPISAQCVNAVVQNPITGHDEKVGAEFNGHDFDIVWRERIAGAWQNATTVSQSTSDDVCPVISIDAAGNTAVAWRRSGTVGRIFYRGRKLESSVGTWQSAEVAVSDGNSDASLPGVVINLSRVWVAWHASAAGQPTSLVVASGGDDERPWPSLFSAIELGSTLASGPWFQDLNAELGHTWSTWLQSPTVLHYRVWQPTSPSWSEIGTEPIVNGDVEQAKATVRTRVTQ